MTADVTNIIFYLILMILMWIFFSQLDKLKAANANCCTNQSCGKDPLDGFFWSAFLSFGIATTLAFLYYSGKFVVKMRTGGRTGGGGFRQMV